MTKQGLAIYLSQSVIGLVLFVLTIYYDYAQTNYICFLLSHCDSHFRNMMLKIFWSPSYCVTFNSRCRELFDCVSDIFEAYRVCSDKEKKTHLVN